jgi:DNA-directed RNA polymerase subunit alpha
MESADVEIVNRDLVLMTLDSDDVTIDMDMTVERGVGYLGVERTEALPIGVIAVDAIFTPVRKVNYRVEATRVGQAINYDRLVLEVWTDGSLSPVDAVNQSAQILIAQLSHFAHLGRPAPLALPGGGSATPVPSGGRFDTPIEDLGLSVRAYNALKRHNVTRVGEIIALSEPELLNIRNFGDKSLTELRERLQELGFTEAELGEGSAVLSWALETDGAEAAPQGEQ